jgi:uncharacterized RDD family membrane protein YckC
MPEAEVRLVSGEAVDLDIRLARAGSRAIALMIDIVVQIVLLYVLEIAAALFVSLVLRPVADSALLAAVDIIVVVLVLVGYPTVIHVVMRGRSVGKITLGLRVVRTDGGPITWRHSFTRALVGTAVEWPGAFLAISWLLSLTILAVSPRAQRLADLAAGTIVIHERSPEGWGWLPTTPGPLADWAATVDLTNVDDQLALAARHFLSRSRSLTEPHRSRLGEALARELLAKVSPPPPPGTPGWAYLAAVVGERHRRAAERLQRNRAIQAKLWPELFPIVPVLPAPGALRPPAPVPGWGPATAAAASADLPATSIRPAAPF